MAERTPTIGFLPPAATYNAIVKSGEARSKQSTMEMLVGSFLAGIYISFGCVLLFSVGGQVPGIDATDPGLANIIKGIFGLPYGLTMVVVLGAELVTGNFMYLFHARIEGRCSWLAVVRQLFLCYFGNLAGALFMVVLIKYSQIWDGKPAMYSVMAVSVAKANNTWQRSILRGILCNWMVCAAVTMSMAAQDVFGKIMAIFLPISLFIAAGFDHCVANMFVIPMGMAYDNKVSVSQFIGYNLVPVTLGNWIAAVFFMSVPYALLYGSLWNNILKLFGIQRKEEDALPMYQIDVKTSYASVSPTVPGEPFSKQVILDDLNAEKREKGYNYTSHVHPNDGCTNGGYVAADDSSLRVSPGSSHPIQVPHQPDHSFHRTRYSERSHFQTTPPQYTVNVNPDRSGHDQYAAAPVAVQH